MMPVAIVMCIDTLIDGLTTLQAKLGRDVELIVRPDGSLSLTVAEILSPPGETASGFEEVASFESVDELLTAMPWMAPEEAA
jgi:hypothetical protein